MSGLDLTDHLQYDASDYARRISNIGSDGNVQMGSEGKSLVYNDPDLVIIVIPVKGTLLCPKSKGADDPEFSSQLQTLAFAANCQHDHDRPT